LDCMLTVKRAGTMFPSDYKPTVMRMGTTYPLDCMLTVKRAGDHKLVELHATVRGRKQN